MMQAWANMIDGARDGAQDALDAVAIAETFKLMLVTAGHAGPSVALVKSAILESAKTLPPSAAPRITSANVRPKKLRRRRPQSRRRHMLPSWNAKHPSAS